MAFKLGQNKAYLKTALDSLLGTVNGTGFKNGIIQQTAAGTFSALTKSTSVTAQSTDNEIPTAAAVKAAVDGATPVWGNITGTLSNQTDLNTALTNTSTQIANLSTNKADKTALALTDRNLKYLAELTKGQAWDTEAGTTPAYQHIVASGAKAVAVDGIGGKTIAYNQLVENGNFVNIGRWGTTNASATVANNVATVTMTAQNGIFTEIVTRIPNHKYLGVADVKTSSSTINLFVGGTGTRIAHSGSGNWEKLATIYTTPSSASSEGYVGLVDVGTSFQQAEIKNVNMYDLTAMGATSSDTDTVEHAKAFLRSQGINPDVYNAYSDNTLVSANVTDATSMSRSLLPLWEDFETTQNGVTVKSVNGTVTFTGTSTGIVNIRKVLDHPVTLPSTVYVHLRNGTVAGNCCIAFYATTASTSQISYVSALAVNRIHDGSQLFGNKTVAMVGFYVNHVSGGTATNLTFTPTIELTNATTDYSPYGTLGTYSIPSAVRALDGYGYGVNGYYSTQDTFISRVINNELDIENKKFIKRLGKITLNGTQTMYKQNASADRYDYRIACSGIAQGRNIVGISARLKWYGDRDALGSNYTGIASSYGSEEIYIGVKDLVTSGAIASNTVADVRTYLTNNPLDVIYELATPTEVDISSYLTEDNVLTVEAGGTLTFTQSNSQTVNIPIPNETVYAINLSEAT